MAVEKLLGPGGLALAYEFTPGRSPVVVFLPGFVSDMNGTKAMALKAHCEAHGQAMLRLDYSGHGASEGRVEDGCIGQWMAEAARVIEAACGNQSLLLVGSSMGGWIALLLALRYSSRAEALLLLAPAPDFVQNVQANLSETQRTALIQDGVIYLPSEYGTPMPLTRKLLEEAQDHLLLQAEIPLSCPVIILHGMRDVAIPWRHSLKLVECLRSDQVELTLIKDGDHRLSRPQDVSLLIGGLGRLLGEDGA
jgi:pimeloyl-ACP methyl ester carboxylesterase